MDMRYTYDGIELAYSIEGQGDTVVLLHGWGCDRNIWRPTVEFLGNSYRIIAVDFAGFGQSQEPNKVWGVEEYTRSIEALMQELGEESPILFGHSFGGRVSLLYASRNRCSGVVLTDAAGVRPKRSFSYYRKVYTYKLMKHLLPLLIGEHKAQMLLEQRRAKSGSSDYNRASQMMRAILSKCVNEDLCHVMPKIEASTLLFWGDRDTATPLSDGQKMERLIANSMLVVAEGCGHFAMLESPDLWQKSVENFLKMNG
jgi:pimeloyl-ACP methyl ester carboxylesterase